MHIGCNYEIAADFNGIHIMSLYGKTMCIIFTTGRNCWLIISTRKTTSFTACLLHEMILHRGFVVIVARKKSDIQLSTVLILFFAYLLITCPSQVMAYACDDWL